MLCNSLQRPAEQVIREPRQAGGRQAKAGQSRQDRVEGRASTYPTTLYSSGESQTQMTRSSGDHTKSHASLVAASNPLTISHVCVACQCACGGTMSVSVAQVSIFYYCIALH